MKTFFSLVARLFALVHDRWLQIPARGRNAILVCSFGALVGFVAVSFHTVVEKIAHHTYLATAGLPVVWFLAGSFVCVVGASLLATALVRKFDPSTAGGGVLPTKLAFWKDFGYLPMRTAAVKFTASALTLGGGVSVGPEGPVVQVGAATMSSVAGLAGVPKQKRRMYCASGAAGALAAAFNAPLAAIAFVLEEIIGDIGSKLIGAILLASVMGALIAHAVIGPQPAFQVGLLEEPTWRALLLCPLVALIAAAAGAGFQRGVLAVRGRMLQNGKLLPGWTRPTLGAVGSWAVAASAFLITGHMGVFGVGYQDVTACIRGDLDWHVALVLGAGKLLATLVAVGAGACGGIFAPNFFIGAMCGGLVAAGAAEFMPLTESDQSILVMAGMCAGLVAVIRTPITCILLIFEITHQFVIVPIILVATLISHAASKRIVPEDLYENMLLQDGENPHHVLPPRDFRKWREMPVGALATFRPVVARSLELPALKELMTASRHQVFPVQAEDGTITHLLMRAEIEHALNTGMRPKLEAVVWVSPEETLGEVQHRLIETPANFLCLGDPQERRLLGVFTLHDLLRGQEGLVAAEEDEEA
ncbi:MAG: chloride channel protein [Verrucomicrobiota bacterium]